ncbi:MAG TPA: hypothetical protein VK204_19910 [Nocardioidaceae bacterium]|nr:hypothetical protein [Nocardioidaceae bacterium]
MAGGMRRKRDGPTMAERVARSSADLEECPARHCWVVDSLDGVKRAALLLEWRLAAVGGWEGRVVYLAKLRAGVGWTVVEEWVPAACLVER